MPDQLIYVPSPTFHRFHKSDVFTRAVVGPVGSGKSVGMVMEMLSRACRQTPHNGIRASKWAVIRSTYRQLDTTTVPTFMRWVGQYGTLTKGSPYRFLSKAVLPDQTQLHWEVLFFPLDSPEDVRNLKSLEITSAWINEASEITHNFTTDIKERMGRYPAKIDGGFNWNGLLIDTNPPHTDHWFYELFEQLRPPDHQLFRQPGALLLTDDGYVPNPDAENIQNHTKGYGYYFDMLHGSPPDKIAVNVLGQYAQTFDGSPVYRGYQDDSHSVDDPLIPSRGAPIVIGLDFGLNPAAMFTQMTPTGTLMVFDEIVPSAGIGFADFLDNMLLPRLRGLYAGFDVLVIGDPTGVNRNSMSLRTVYDMLRELSVPAVPAVTNDIALRLDSVKWFLGRHNGLIVNRAGCPLLRKGFLGGYRFAPKRGRHAVGFGGKPDKNEFSHPHDALQYAALYYWKGQGVGAGTKVFAGSRSGRKVSVPTMGRRKFLWA